MGGIFSKDAHPTLQPGQRLHGFHGRVPEPPPAAGPGGTAPRAPAAASPQHRARHCLPGAAQASGLGTAAMEVGRDTPPTSPHPLHGGRASPPRLGRCRCQLSPARLLRSEIDFTLAGLETLARVFDSPASPRSPAREQVSPPPAPSQPAATCKCFGMRGWVQLVCRGDGGAVSVPVGTQRWEGKLLLLPDPRDPHHSGCSLDPQGGIHRSGATALLQKCPSFPSGSPDQRSRP